MATTYITVSIEIMHDTNLNQSQKFILAEIEQLNQLDKGCFASNAHFSKLIGITKENVSRNLKGLTDKGYISVETVNGSRNHERIITLIKVVRPPYQSSKTPLSKQQETKDNIQTNITINNKVYNQYVKSKKTISNSESKIILDFISYRKEIKKPIATVRPLASYYDKIVDLHSKGYDIKHCIGIMKNKEWQTIEEEWLIRSGITKTISEPKGLNKSNRMTADELARFN